MWKNLLRNPAAVLALVAAVLQLLVASGVGMSSELQDAVQSLVSAALVVISLLALNQTPNKQVVTKLDARGDEVAATASSLRNGTLVVHSPVQTMDLGDNGELS